MPLPLVRAFAIDAIRTDSRARASFSLLLKSLAKGIDSAELQRLHTALLGEGLACEGEFSDQPLLGALAARRLVCLQSDGGGFTVQFLPTPRPASSERAADRRAKLTFSRFTLIQREGTALALRNPLSDRWALIDDPALAAELMRFAAPASPDPGDAAVYALVRLLHDGGLLVTCREDGTTDEDHDPDLQSWEVHDLLLHSRSRLGRSATPVGSGGGMAGAPCPPADVGAGVVEWIDLPDPSQPNPTLLAGAIAARRSHRSFAAAPVDPQALGAMLKLALGTRGAARRAYPNGGAIYEQGFYLAVRGSPGLPCGLYRYDPEKHRLGQLDCSEGGVIELLDDAAATMAVTEKPPILIVITSRYAEVRRKYGGLAYALQLKHVGVIQEALYLAATATGLGGCALGSGNSDRFAALSGLDYLREGSIGEFALGVPAAGSGRDS